MSNEAPEQTVEPIEEPQPISEAEAAQEALEAMMRELVRLRKKRGLSQKPIAKAIGVSQVRVSQMEASKGGVTLQSVLVYARAIGAQIVVVEDSAKKKEKTPKPST